MIGNNFLANKTIKGLQNMEVMKPSANMGARVDGGASGATSQLTKVRRRPMKRTATLIFIVAILIAFNITA